MTLPRHDVAVRIQEVGEGPPVLFVHGSPNSGMAWAPAAPHLTGLRCLYLDRPGTGLSDPLVVESGAGMLFAETLIVDALDPPPASRCSTAAATCPGSTIPSALACAESCPAYAGLVGKSERGAGASGGVS